MRFGNTYIYAYSNFVFLKEELGDGIINGRVLSACLLVILKYLQHFVT